MVDHSNLRDPSFSKFRDVKHIKKDDIKDFAGNIKKALREAYNVEFNIGSTRSLRNSNDAFQKRENHTDQPKNTDINSRLLEISNSDSNSISNQSVTKTNITQGRGDKELHNQIVNAFTQSMNMIFGF